MAYIATVKILVDEKNEATVYDGLNEILRDAQMGGPNGEFRDWVLDWSYQSVDETNESLNVSIANGSYEEGDAFAEGVTMSKDFTLVVEAFATSEFGEGPGWAKLTVTQEFMRTLVRLRRIIQDNRLESVTTQWSPDYWDQEEELRMRGGSLRVWGDDFWIEAYPKHADYGVETRAINIDALLQAAENHSQLPDGFFGREGIIFFGDNPEDLADVFCEAKACDDCGKQVNEVIGCPDGAEICQACFDAGHH